LDHSRTTTGRGGHRELWLRCPQQSVIDFSEPPANFGEYRLTYRTGDMIAPQIEAAEPLALELKDFASAILENTTPVSSGSLCSTSCPPG